MHFFNIRVIFAIFAIFAILALFTPNVIYTHGTIPLFRGIV